jgi:hypothetical protein
MTRIKTTRKRPETIMAQAFLVGRGDRIRTYDPLLPKHEGPVAGGEPMTATKRVIVALSIRDLIPADPADLAQWLIQIMRLLHA